jgi:hypothetical protein
MVGMDSSPIGNVPRDKYVELCKRRAFDYLDQGDLKYAVASIIGNMNARADCRLPDHLATLGIALLMGSDVPGLRLLIEDLR